MNYKDMYLLCLVILGMLLELGVSLPTSPMLTHYTNMQDCVMAYFNLGYSYKKIVFFLGAVHGVQITLRSLKYLLNEVYGKFRRNNKCTLYYEGAQWTWEISWVQVDDPHPQEEVQFDCLTGQSYVHATGT